MKFYCMNLRWTRMSLQHLLSEAYWLMVETRIDWNWFFQEWLLFNWVNQSQVMAKLRKSMAVMLRNLFMIWISLDRFLFHEILLVLLLERVVKQSKEYRQKLEQKCSLIWVSLTTLLKELYILQEWKYMWNEFIAHKCLNLEY